MKTKTVVICSENPNPDRGVINGVTTATSNMQKSINLCDDNKWQSIYICPRYPGTNASKNVWELPSIDISKWVPSFVATVDKGYRIAYPYAAPFGKKVCDRIAERLSITRPCCVHLQGTHQASEQTAYACLKIGLTYGLTLHTYDEKYIDQRTHISPIATAMKAAHATRSQFIANHAAWVTCPTEWYADKFREFTSFTGKIIICPSIVWPIDTMNDESRLVYEQQFREKLPKHLQKRPLIGCFGRQSPEKNLELAIDMMSELYIIYNSTRSLHKVPALVFIGPGNESYRNQLKEQAKQLGISLYIVWLDGQPYEEMIKLHQIFPHQFFPAKLESQGLMRVEAQMCKSLACMLENNALSEGYDEPSLIAKDSASDCAKALFYTLNNPGRNDEIRERQKIIAYKQNNPLVYGNKLLELYSQLGYSS